MFSVPVTDLIKQRMPLTLFLAAYATIMSIVITVPLAMIAALKKDRWIDNLIRGGFMLALGMPQFWLGIIMLLLFSLWIPIFPISGFGDTVGEHFMHMTLPAFTLALAQSSWLVRSLRSDIINVLQADYVDFARAKGLRERFIFLRHILRNSLLPTVTILGLNVGYLVGGAVVVERVFAIPGMGGLMLDAIFGRDYSIVQGVTFTFAILVIVINLLTDLTYSFLDPRVTLG